MDSGLLNPYMHCMSKLHRIGVFCGSRAGVRPDYVEAGAKLGAALSRRGIGLVYGGASIGVMGALADAVLAGGGRAIGVIPQRLKDREIAHAGLSELRVVTSMHERKATMEHLSDAFIAAPGGFGTQEEIFEIITWLQLGLHHKPVGFFNVTGFYDPLLAFIAHSVAEGFIPEAHAEAIEHDTDADRLIDKLLARTPPAQEQVIRRSET